MTKYAYIEFRDKVKKALQGEKDGLAWSQLRKEGKIGQTYMCYTWARELEKDVGLFRERRGRKVFGKLKKS